MLMLIIINATWNFGNEMKYSRKIHYKQAEGAFCKANKEY
jgi:hypothetical protein